MAKPDKRQAKGDQRTKCEYPRCAVTFTRDSDRRRHVKEQHGPPIYCCYPGCEWTTRRMGKLRTHLNNVHQSQVSTNPTLPSEFRTATAQYLASPNYFSALDANISFNSDPTTPPISTDYAFTPQVPPDGLESHAALNSERASTPEHKPILGSPISSITRVQVAPYRIFKPCRVRRRTACPTTRTSPAGPSQTRLGSAMESTPDFYSSGQDKPSLFTQWMHCAFNVEPIASIIGSLSLD